MGRGRVPLTLMPTKAICSPVRPADSLTGKQSGSHSRNRSLPRIGIGRGGLLNSWEKNTQSRVEVSEPTSPKVTCSGRVKVRRGHSAATCKSWQSVAQEVEKIHVKEKGRKRSALGFKKDVLSFLTCLRSIRLDLRCFRAFSRHEISSNVEEAEQDCDSDRTEVSKWYMVVPKATIPSRCSAGGEVVPPSVPPSNALFLMRCSSAPSRSCLDRKREEDEDTDSKVDDILQMVYKRKKLRTLMEEEKKIDISARFSLPRSRSCKG